MSNREKVAFNHDVFVRNSHHFERKEQLAKGHDYKVGMLLARGSDGILKPYKAGDNGTALFLAVSDLNLTEASENGETPVVVTGQFWSNLIVLPEGTTLTSLVDGNLLIDELRLNGLLAVDQDFTYYQATPIHGEGE